MTRNAGFKHIFRILFVLVAWFGLAGHFNQIVLQRSADTALLRAVVSYFSYFTIQSNWLAALWWSIAIFSQGLEPAPVILRPKVKGALTVYISVTLIAFAVLLSKTYSPQGIDLVISNITHYITPLAFIFDWVLFEKKRVYQWKYAIDWLTYPLVYFIYAMAYAAVTGRYLYPFFDLNALGAGGVALQTAFLLVLFLILASFYILVNKYWPVRTEFPT